jgi:hypothetical protein
MRFRRKIWNYCVACVAEGCLCSRCRFGEVAGRCDVYPSLFGEFLRLLDREIRCGSTGIEIVREEREE